MWENTPNTGLGTLPLNTGLGTLPLNTGLGTLTPNTGLGTHPSTVSFPLQLQWTINQQSQSTEPTNQTMFGHLRRGTVPDVVCASDKSLSCTETMANGSYLCLHTPNCCKYFDVYITSKCNALVKGKLHVDTNITHHIVVHTCTHTHTGGDNHKNVENGRACS